MSDELKSVKAHVAIGSQFPADRPPRIGQDEKSCSPYTAAPFSNGWGLTFAYNANMQLSPLQRVHRRLALFFGSSYTHPCGTIELDIDEKAGIDPTVDDEETQDRKFDAWNRNNSLKELRWQWFFYGAVVGGLFVYWFLHR